MWAVLLGNFKHQTKTNQWITAASQRLIFEFSSCLPTTADLMLDMSTLDGQDVTVIVMTVHV